MIFNNIEAIAKKRNMTIRQVEIKAGLSNGSIGKWKTRSPHVNNLLAVAKALNVSVNTLLKGVE